MDPLPLCFGCTGLKGPHVRERTGAPTVLNAALPTAGKSLSDREGLSGLSAVYLIKPAHWQPQGGLASRAGLRRRRSGSAGSDLSRRPVKCASSHLSSVQTPRPPVHRSVLNPCKHCHSQLSGFTNNGCHLEEFTIVECLVLKRNTSYICTYSQHIGLDTFAMGILGC